jgi:hypothetical protein
VVGGPPLSSGVKNCVTHTDEAVQLFCETCQQPVCVRCSVKEHRKHRLLALGEKLYGSKDYLQVIKVAFPARLCDFFLIHVQVR